MYLEHFPILMISVIYSLSDDTVVSGKTMLMATKFDRPYLKDQQWYLCIFIVPLGRTILASIMTWASKVIGRH